MRNPRAACGKASRLLQAGLLSVLLCGVTAAAADEKRPSAVLSLDDGGFAAGDLADSDRPGILRWQAAGFVAPFEFKLGRVNAVQWTARRETGEAGGRVLFRAGWRATWSSGRWRASTRARRRSMCRESAGSTCDAIGDPPDLPLARECGPDLSGPERAFGLA